MRSKIIDRQTNKWTYWKMYREKMCNVFSKTRMIFHTKKISFLLLWWIISKKHTIIIYKRRRNLRNGHKTETHILCITIFSLQRKISTPYKKTISPENDGLSECKIRFTPKWKKPKQALHMKLWKSTIKVNLSIFEETLFLFLFFLFFI